MPVFRFGAALFFFGACCSFAQSSVSVVDTIYSAPSTLFNGSITAVNRSTGSAANFVVANGILSIDITPGSYRVTYLAGDEQCVEVWQVPRASSALTIFQLRGHLSQCNVSSASDAHYSYRDVKGRLVAIPNILKPNAYHSVQDAGAIPDAIMRSDGAMTANSAVLASPSGSFTAKDVGKYVEVIGAGSGGATHSDGAMTAGNNVLTSASGSFISTDAGRYIVVIGAGAKGANLVAQISAYISPTQVSLGTLSGTQMVAAKATVTVSAAAYFYGYMTLEATIASYQSAKQVTLDRPAAGSISNAMYVYGTNNAAHFQAELDALGAAGGGIVHVPAPPTCPSGATCGYITAATDMATALNPGAIKIRYSGLSLVGDSPQTNIFCRGSWNLVNGAVVRGHCVLIGDDGGPNGHAGEAISDISVSSLHLWGMTNGNTYNSVFPASITTGDGWDWTNKPVFIFHDVPHKNLSITNNVIQDFKGENIWGGGMGLANMLIQGNTISNFNGDGISVSVDDLQVLNNTIFNGYSAIEDGIFGATTTRHLYQSNQISLMRGSGITLVSEDNFTGAGNIQVVDNTFDTVGQIIKTPPAQAIYVALGAGAAPLANVTIERNLCHDCWGFIIPIPGPNLRVSENVMTVDAYNGATFFLFPTIMNSALVEDNRSYMTPSALANKRFLNYIYVLTLSAAANSLSYRDVTFLNNNWQANGAIYYMFSTTSGAGFAALKDKNIIWRGDACVACNADTNLDRGSQIITDGGTIEPYGPQVLIFSGTGTPAMTVDASKEQDGSELGIQNAGAVAVKFVSDNNLNLTAPLSLAVGQKIKLRYSAIDSKWHLVSQ